MIKLAGDYNKEYILSFAAILCLIFLYPLQVFAENPVHSSNIVKTENTRISLLSSHESVKVGDKIEIGILIEPKLGWHTYWQNPGDAGIATQLEWKLPKAVTAGEIKWPVPEIIKEDFLTVYGYKNRVFLPVDLVINDSFSEDNLSISVNASWLVCEKICIPENAELSIEITISNNSTVSKDIEIFNTANDKLPKQSKDDFSYKFNDENIEITIPESIARKPKTVYFFPRNQDLINHSADQKISADNILRIARGNNSDNLDNLSGLIVIDNQSYDIISANYIATNISTNSSTTSSSTKNHSTNISTIHSDNKSNQNYANQSLIWIIFSAFIGGLILNLMPCVLPILSLKALSIAKKSGHEQKIIIRQSLAYSFGVLLSFAIIAFLLISLQQAGEIIGWGYQMQSPPFVAFLAVLLFMVGLNLAGAFDLPVLFGNLLAETKEHSLRGSFATGILSVAVAAPCTAPFMATAVGATISMPPLISLFIFLVIGCGMSAPFLLIAFFPRMVNIIPKPGAWMESFKQFLAFPMFASVVWLLWVITVQTGAQGLLIVLVTMLAISFIIWLKNHCKDQSAYCRIAIILLIFAVLINGLIAISASKLNENTENNLKNYSANSAKNNQENKFSEKLLAELRAENIPVFVDVTAAWCLTCQLNKRIAIDTENTRASFARTKTRLLIADWTNRNQEITLFLKRFGHNGVPLYVYFPAGKEAQILPQLLSENIIINAIENAH